VAERIEKTDLFAGKSMMPSESLRPMIISKENEEMSHGMKNMGNDC
jgi:hypothetical protein